MGVCCHFVFKHETYKRKFKLSQNNVLFGKIKTRGGAPILRKQIWKEEEKTKKAHDRVVFFRNGISPKF